MTDLRALWDDSDPALWRRAATDWRGMWLDAMADTMTRNELAELVGFKGVGKVGELIAEWRQVKAALYVEDPDATARVMRAMDFDRMVRERHATTAT